MEPAVHLELSREEAEGIELALDSVLDSGTHSVENETLWSGTLRKLRAAMASPTTQPDSPKTRAPEGANPVEG